MRNNLLAVVHALEHWHGYVDVVEFTVVTDHSLNMFFHEAGDDHSDAGARQDVMGRKTV